MKEYEKTNKNSLELKEKEDVSTDLKRVLLEYGESMVESHLDGWGDRYYMKPISEIQEDLYLNHDPSIELDNVSEWLGRELLDNETDIVEEYFNESVLNKFRELCDE